MASPLACRVRRPARAALVALSSLTLITCAEDPIGPATGEARLRIVPVFTSSLAAPLTIDAVRVAVTRPDSQTAVFDDTVSFSPDANSLTLRDVRIRMTEQSEDLEVLIQLLAGATVMFDGTQTVTVIRGSSTQPTTIPLTYRGPGANVARLLLGPRDTTIDMGAVLDFRLDAFDSAGAPVAQYYASWSLTGGPATGARINAAGRLTAPAVPDTFFVKAVNLPTNSADSTRVIVTAPTPPPPAATNTPIAAGEEHTCEIRGTTTYCWGGNDLGQLGDSTLTRRLVPTPVHGGHTFVSLSAGLFHTCGLTGQGQAYCWGEGSSGALGDGANANSAMPVAVSGGHTFAQLATGDGYSCGITPQGVAWCWGNNGTGSLGDGTTNSSAVPVQVAGGHNFVRITAAGTFENTSNHTCAIDNSSVAWCWGDNGDSQLGDGTITRRLTPVAVGGGLTFKEISAGGLSACGITSAGALYCWGQIFGAGGSPQPVPGGLTFTLLDMGDGHLCALSGSGWRCAGANGLGQLGDGTGQPQTTPVAPSGGLTFTSVSAGSAHSCGQTATVTYCWGLNASGQLGTVLGGTSTLAPIQVAGPPASVVLVAGNNQSGPTATPLAASLSVRVRNAAAAPLPGVQVRFDVSSGGGTIDGLTSVAFVSDDAGVVTVGPWILGATPGSNTITATVEALGVSGNPVTFTATATSGAATVTWTGAVDNQWATAGNWTPRPPAVGDNVVIPATARSPVLATTPVSINNLTIQSGAAIDLGQTVLGVSGSLAADGPINGFGTNAGLVLVGAAGAMHGSIDANVVISGAYLLDGNLTLGFNSTGLFAISVPGSLVLNGHTARIRGSFATAGTGTLSMTNPLDSLVVSAGTLGGGTVLMSGGSTAGKLTNGRMLVSTDLAQSGDPAAFSPSGSHRTVFTSGATIVLLDTVSSGFQDLDLNGQTVSSQSALPIRGTLIAGGLSFLELPGANGVTANSVNVSALTVEGGPFTIGNGTITRFDSVTFAQQDPARAQLTVRNNGSTTPLAFDGLYFVAPPTTGVYLDAIDLDNSAPALTINMVNARPATSASFRVSGGAVVNWGGLGGTINWNGSADINWNNPANWTPSRLPAAGDSVVIPNAVTNYPTLSGRVTVGAMFEDGRLTIDGGTLEVMRGTTSNNGINRIIFLTNPTDSLIIHGDNASPTSGTGGVYVAGGNVAVPGNFQNVRLVLNGTANQLLAGSGLSNVQIGTLTIDKPSGNVTTNSNNLFTGDSVALLSGGLVGGGNFQLAGGFFGAAGTTVNLTGSLQVGRNISALGSYAAGTTTFAMATATVVPIPVLPYTNLTISGNTLATLTGRTVATGAVSVTGTGAPQLRLNGNTLAVGGALSTSGISAAMVVMTNPLDSLLVNGSASFAAGVGGNPGNLTAGTFVLAGNFTQSNQFGGVNFQATGTHKTVLTGNNPTVIFNEPGLATNRNRFANLTWTGNGTLTVGDTALIVTGTLTTTAATPVTFASTLTNGSRVQFGVVAASGPLTFSKTPVTVLQTGTGTAIGLGNATFTNMPATLVQLAIQHPGVAGGLSLPNLTFSTLPTAPTGFYLSATDNDGATPVALTINMVTPNPADPAGLIATSGGALINWGPAAITWNGGSSTDWSTGANWSGGIAPGATDSAVIPAGAARQPALTAPVSVGAVVINAGTLNLNGQTLTVSRGFVTAGTGTLTSNTAASLLVVAGNAVFGGGDETGLLTDGNLRVAGNFSQGGTANSFVATGNHTTFFNGTGAQLVTLANGGAASSRFQKVRVSNGTGVVTVSGSTPEMVVSDTLGLATGATLTGATAVSSPHVITNIGSTLSVFLLTVPAGGLSVLGTYGVDLTILTGGGVVPPLTYKNLRLTGAGGYTLGTDINTSGYLDLQSGLTVGGRTVTVAGDFMTTGSGTLTMTNAADLVTVAGSTSFYGGAETGKLTAGILRTSNQFLQDATTSSAAFVASGSHTVEIVSQNPTGGVVNLGNPTVSHFQNLRVLFLSSFTSDVEVKGNMEVNFNVAANLDARRVRVAGAITKGGIGVFHPQRLTLLGASTVAGGTVVADTLEFLGSAPQTFPGSTSVGQVLVANDVTAPAGSVGISKDLVIQNGGIFRLGTGGSNFTVAGNLSTAGTGTLEMKDANAVLAVAGDATFAGGSTDGLLTAGTFQVGGNFTQSAVAGPTTSYAPSGTHKTVFVNTATKAISMGSPGPAGNGSHFQVLDVSGATGGLTLDVNMQADSIISTSAAAKISSPGVTLTARRSQISGLTLVTTNFVIDELGAVAAEVFNNVTFSGYSGFGPMLSVTGPGSAAALRTLTLTNVNFPTLSASDNGLYVALTSSNDSGFNLIMSGSNQSLPGGNGPSFTSVTPQTGVAFVTW